MKKTVLLTGGAGFVGSHTAVSLLRDYEVVIVDNLSNAHADVVERIERITGRRPHFYNIDIGQHSDEPMLNTVFTRHTVHAVIHFAGYKHVGESTHVPLAYHANNIGSLLTMLRVMQRHGCKKLIFSSSCTVYGVPEHMPVVEALPVCSSKCTMPYGRSKAMCEEILKDLVRFGDDPDWQVVLLRYFNPAGAHPSALIGEDPHGVPSNLMPFMCQVATGQRDVLNVFGSDYDTPDGTPMRDYIHVMDVADGHVAALQKCLLGVGSLSPSAPGFSGAAGDKKCFVFNLGTGTGYSVLDVVHAMRRVTGQPVQYKLAPRRGGDVPKIFCDPSLVHRDLSWRAKRSLDDMCADAFRWAEACREIKSKL